MTDLAFFIHTHKCAGTAVVDLFRNHDFVRMYPGSERHAAMPQFLRELKTVEDEQDFTSRYHPEAIAEFIASSVRSDVNFVATEWVVPPLHAVRRRADIFTFTVLRDPFDRYLSNYHFDRKMGYSQATDLWNYKDRSMFRQYDYYTRLFSSKLVLDDSPVDASDHELAHRCLGALDAIVVLEQPETFRLLEPLGISVSKLGVKNATTAPKTYPEEFRDYFMDHAAGDYQLYDDATRLSLAQLRAHDHPRRSLRLRTDLANSTPGRAAATSVPSLKRLLGRENFRQLK